MAREALSGAAEIEPRQPSFDKLCPMAPPLLPRSAAGNTQVVVFQARNNKR